jgi:hypothetical protein
MDEQRRAIAALIDQIVRESNLPGRRQREELRRELESHFEEAGGSADAARDALARFGSPDAVSDGFRRAYRRGRLALYVAKVLASVIVSTIVALLLQAVVNLRVELGHEVLRLAPGFAISARTSTAIVLLVVAAWELGIEPLCARLERRPVRLLATLAAFFAAISVAHMVTSTHIHPGVAFVASGTLIAVWACTIAILSRFDLAFLRFLGPKR